MMVLLARYTIQVLNRVIDTTVTRMFGVSTLNIKSYIYVESIGKVKINWEREMLI